MPPETPRGIAGPGQGPGPANTGVFAVVLVYAAGPGAVAENLHDLQGQVDGLVLVDNSGERDAGRWSVLGTAFPLITVMNGGNEGVARGFNLGIGTALDRGAQFVLLLDDDSRPAAGMTGKLLAAWHSLSGSGERPAAVGPDFRDGTTGQQAVFIHMDGWRMNKLRCGGSTGVLHSDYIMTSGVLVHRAVFPAVGVLEEGLFIDYVDTEWCLRARDRGFSCFAACDASMTHRFGAGAVRLPWGQVLPRRPPVRSYYIFRNALLLMRRGYIPLRWKINTLRRLLTHGAAYLLTWRLEHLRMMGLGMLHGLYGRTGPFPA